MNKRELNRLSITKAELNALENDALFCGSFKAYFSTYNTVNYRPDRMIKGCFDDEIRRFKNGDKKPRFLALHYGADVIGVIDEMDDDDFGAYVSGRFTATTKGRDAYINLKSGAIDEFSFAFYVTDSRVVEEDGRKIREVLRVEGIEEISMVTWGMDPNTKPIEVNRKENPTIRDAENALEAAGFSDKRAKKILANGFKAEGCDGPGPGCDVPELNSVFEDGFNSLFLALRKENKDDTGRIKR